MYESFYRNLPVSKYNQTEQTYGPNELHDVAYYNRMKFAKIDEQYDIDSPDDFIWFAKDHYGELGLSRLNIFASDTERSGLSFPTVILRMPVSPLKLPQLYISPVFH